VGSSPTSGIDSASVMSIGATWGEKGGPEYLLFTLDRGQNVSPDARNDRVSAKLRTWKAIN
ncbi:MAG: hypothetical protein KAT00_08320, partial [Planctomycetes bacterium]|nr:hypothetical protein [Planctomycetota bacterium]